MLLSNSPLPPSLRPTPRQVVKLEVLESNENDVRPAVGICGFGETALKRIDIWVIIIPIRDGQRPLRNVEP